VQVGKELIEKSTKISNILMFTLLISVVPVRKLEKTLARQYACRVRHEGLEKRDAGVKGFGVFSTRSFLKGEFLCEYEGKLEITSKEDMTEGEYLFNYKVGKVYYRSLNFH
jgi:hypothetical protein